MPVNSYECLFLLDPTKAATDADGVKTQLHGTLEKYGAEILASRKWDDRKLAYSIEGHKKGVYHLAFFKADSLKVTEIDHDFRVNLSEVVLRHLITVVDPKWEEDLLNVARDEHQSGLQLYRDESPEATTANEPGLEPVPDLGLGFGDIKPRRGPRRSPEQEIGKE